MVWWVHVKRGCDDLAAGVSVQWSIEEVADLSCMQQISLGRQTIPQMHMGMAGSRLGRAAADCMHPRHREDKLAGTTTDLFTPGVTRGRPLLPQTCWR